MRPKVYVHRLGEWYSLYMNQENEALLHSAFDVVNERGRDTPLSEEELTARMEGAQAILSLNGVGTEEITEKVLARVGTVKLIVISHWWNQFETLDLDSLGIRVLEGSNANTIAVAEWVLAAALMSVRKLNHYDDLLKQGSPWCEPRMCGGMLYGKKVGLVGLGRIGRYCAHLFHMMGARVAAFDKYLTDEEARELHVQKATLAQVMGESDIVSLHLPVLEETRNLVSGEYIRMIKDGATLINSARAAIYDEEALLGELQTGRITAYLDVFRAEPLDLDSPLRRMDNVLITPHIAGYNKDMFHLCGKQAIMTLKDAFDGKEPADSKFKIG